MSSHRHRYYLRLNSFLLSRSYEPFFFPFLFFHSESFHLLETSIFRVYLIENSISFTENLFYWKIVAGLLCVCLSFPLFLHFAVATSPRRRSCVVLLFSTTWTGPGTPGSAVASPGPPGLVRHLLSCFQFL